MLTLFQLYLSAMSSPQPAKTQNKHKKVDRNSSCNGLGKVAASCTHTWLKIVKLLVTRTSANCTQVRSGCSRTTLSQSLWADKINTLQAAPSPSPHHSSSPRVVQTSSSPRRAQATQMLKSRQPGRKTCKEEAAGAASSRQKQQQKEGYGIADMEGHD